MKYFGFSGSLPLFSWYHILRNMWHFVRKTETPHNPHPRIVFLIAARRLTSILDKTVDAVNNSCREAGLSNYEIKLVVDEAEGSISGVQTILVPKEYICRSKYQSPRIKLCVGLLAEL